MAAKINTTNDFASTILFFVRYLNSLSYPGSSFNLPSTYTPT